MILLRMATLELYLDGNLALAALKYRGMNLERDFPLFYNERCNTHETRDLWSNNVRCLGVVRVRGGGKYLE